MQPPLEQSGVPARPAVADVPHNQHGRYYNEAPASAPAPAYARPGVHQDAGILPALTSALISLHDNTLGKLEKIEASINALSINIAQVREQAHGDSLTLAEWLERSHMRQAKATQVLSDRVVAIEGIIGTVPSLHQDATLTGRLQRIDCVLHELLECSNDPGAARINTFHTDVSVNTDFVIDTQKFVDMGVDPAFSLPELVNTGTYPCPPETIDAGVDSPNVQLSDASVGTELPGTVDAGVDALTVQLSDASVGTEPLGTVDAGVGAPTVQLSDVSVGTEPLNCIDVGIDVHTLTYVDAAVDLPTSQYADAAVVTDSVDPITDDHVHLLRRVDSYAAVLQPRFPISPYRSDPLTPAQWSPQSNDTDSSENLTPASHNSNMSLEEIAECSALCATPSGSLSRNTSHGPHDLKRSEGLLNVLGLQSSPDVSESRSDDVAVQMSPPNALRDVSVTGISAQATTLAANVSSVSISPIASSPTVMNPSTSTATSVRNSTSPKPPMKKSSGCFIQIPLPRNLRTTVVRVPSVSTSPPLSPPHVSSQLKNSLSSLSLLSSSASPPPPPLPRRVRGLGASQSRAPVRSESPGFEIIEAPTSVTGNSFHIDNGKGKVRSKIRPRDEGQDLDKSRKRRKTDEFALQSASQRTKTPSRPRKTLDETEVRKTLAPLASTSKMASTSAAKSPTGEILCDWPAKVNGDVVFQREFVQCDNCDGWYHFGCVGFTVGDPRLESDSEYFCPPCQVAQAQRGRRHAHNTSAATCARPDCNIVSDPSQVDEYFVDRIIGRMPQKLGEWTPVPSFVWLVKWFGYPVTDASWTMPENLGDGTRYIADFEDAAEIEGHDLNDPHEVVLLNEAAAAGWL